MKEYTTRWAIQEYATNMIDNGLENDPKNMDEFYDMVLKGALHWCESFPSEKYDQVYPQLLAKVRSWARVPVWFMKEFTADFNRVTQLRGENKMTSKMSKADQCSVVIENMTPSLMGLEEAWKTGDLKSVRQHSMNLRKALSIVEDTVKDQLWNNLR